MDIPKHPTLYCYYEPAKLAQSRAIRKVYRQAAKLLPDFVIKTHFNPGGIAVWGETYAYIYRTVNQINSLPSDPPMPVVEAYDTSMGLLVRQWDGRNSGANCYVQTLEQFVSLVQALASKAICAVL